MKVTLRKLHIMLTTKNKKRYKKWGISILVLLLIAAASIWYIFTEKFEDTCVVKEDFNVEAIAFINEFTQGLEMANQKYAEKIVVVNGIVSKIETADTSSNIIIADTTNGSYAIFGFQKQHQAETKSIKAGDKVSIKGSCSGGSFSQILETHYVTFKRCAINQ